MELEQSLSKLLDEHQRESGLHMIGGRQRLIHRLVTFFETERQHENLDPALIGQREN